MVGNESQSHYFLKRIAYEILKNRYNLNENNIIFEYSFKNRFVDVVGITKEGIIAIECGQLKSNKQLQLETDNEILEFIHLTIKNHKEFIPNEILQKIKEEKKETVMEKTMNNGIRSGTTNINFILNEELHREFKIKSTKNGEKIKEAIVTAIKDYVKK